MYYSLSYLLNTWYSENLEPHVRKLFIFVLTWVSPALVFGQILSNLIEINAPTFYGNNSNLFAWLFGMNFMYCLAMVCLSGLFKFCRWTRWAALGELIIAIQYRIADPKEYNESLLWFQIVVGSFALIMTFRSFVKAYPNCRLSKVRYFIKLVFATHSCSTALEIYLHNYEKTEIIKIKINANKY